MNYCGKFTKIDLEALTMPGNYAQGMKLFHQGAVFECCQLGIVRAAFVTEAQLNYRVKIIFAKEELTGECLCNSSFFCQHMVAVSLAWLEAPTSFFDLQTDLKECLADTNNLSRKFMEICTQDPLNFLEFCRMPKVITDFRQQRDLINLIRNAFSHKLLTTVEIKALWESMIQIKSILTLSLAKHEPEVLIACQELIQAMAIHYRTDPNQVLIEYLRQISLILKQLPSKFEPLVLKELFELIIQLYFEPALSEWQEMLAEVLLTYARFEPHFLMEFLNQKIMQSEKLFELVAVHELLRHLDAQGTPEAAKLLIILEEQMWLTSAGQLWLIDWNLEHNLVAATEMARQGLQTADRALQLAFRERLLNCEIKQGNSLAAAELSLAQFRAESSFEEYLRLKEILQKFPQEWDDYQVKVVEILKNNTNFKISMLIALTEGKTDLVSEKFVEILADEELLLTVVEVCLKQELTTVMVLYPQLIKGLVARKVKQNWIVARKLLIFYKKQLLQGQNQQVWRQLRIQLLREYGADTQFREYFGSLL